MSVNNTTMIAPTANEVITEKEHMTKLVCAVSISLATEIIKAVVGKSIPNSIDITDVPKIAASVITSNLLS